jgi:pimeloyl-ACP methyl ester carboxylesterase
MAPLIGQSISPGERAPRLDGRAFEDGMVPYLAQDASFTLDQLAALNQADPNGILTGRLDLQRAGIFGVSLGGIVGGEACRLEPRLRACLVMDAPLPADVVRAGLQQPTMWISRDAETMQLEGWSQAGDQGIDAHQTTMRAVFESLPRDGYLVLVRGMFHLNLTDIPYWSPLTSLLGLTGPIDAQRAHSIINAYSLAFFDRHLKGRPATLLDGPAEQYPEVLVQEEDAHRQRPAQERRRPEETRQGPHQGVRSQGDAQRQEGQERHDVEVDQLCAACEISCAPRARSAVRRVRGRAPT